MRLLLLARSAQWSSRRLLILELDQFPPAAESVAGRRALFDLTQSNFEQVHQHRFMKIERKLSKGDGRFLEVLQPSHAYLIHIFHLCLTRFLAGRDEEQKGGRQLIAARR
jgi:hypothetical protein